MKWSWLYFILFSYYTITKDSTGMEISMQMSVLEFDASNKYHILIC